MKIILNKNDSQVSTHWENIMLDNLLEELNLMLTPTQPMFILILQEI